MESLGSRYQNHFSTSNLDRAADYRKDDTWINENINNVNSRFILINESKNLFEYDDLTNPVYLSLNDLKSLNINSNNPIFLGIQNDKIYFTIEVAQNEIITEIQNKKVGKFINLRTSASVLDQDSCALLAYGRAMTYWHYRHKFCGICGSPTENREGGNVLICTNKECMQHHFPRTDPAIIVLVSFEDKCLLGRQPQWPEGIYSTIAGFVEPGESLENTVKREVMEETKIKVTNIKYFASQPWPFPSSLMLGFYAEAITNKIDVELNELEDAKWFSRDSIINGLKNNKLKLSTKYSISFRLIENWFNLESSEYLGEIVDKIYGN